MKFISYSALFSSLFLLLGSVTATQVAYLANCVTTEGELNNFSAVEFYLDVSESQDGQQPADECVTDPSGDATWETGTLSSCTLSKTGLTFRWIISTNAAGLSTGSFAGVAFLGSLDFNCYRGNSSILFQSVDEVCDSVYYCLQ